jgi:hypothetical protein
MTTIDANDTAIHTRALLVWLQISSWSARKYDKAVTNKVNRDYAASSDAGRYNKFLFAGDAPSYKHLVQLLGALRTWHYSETLAWSDEGRRLLPIANFTRYTDGLRERQAEIDRAVNAFIADYPALRAQAAIRLNGLYRAEDYPMVSDLRSKFSISLAYDPVPTVGDIRVNLSADQIAAVEANVLARASSSVDTAMRDAWERLHTVVSHVAIKLADPSAIFRDSLIENVRECCDVLQRLNVTNDGNLESMRANVLQQISSMAPQTLRDSKHARQQTADKAKAILDQMSAFYAAK